MTNDTAASPAPAAGASADTVSAPRGTLHTALDWLTLRDDIARARAGEPALDGEALRRGRAAFALAERALDPAQPLREGFSGALALSLYREATYWTLCALHAVPFTQQTLAAALTESPPSLLLAAATSEQALKDLGHCLVEQSFVQTADADSARQDEWAREARAFVAALLRRAEQPGATRARLIWQRGIRLSLSLVAVLLVALGVSSGVARLRLTPDLAQGKPWRTSSTYATCSPAEHSCAGSQSDILFHTAEEDSPWFELDLGAATEFAHVDVTNRSDCCEKRAYPLAIEVSNDASSWKEVARKSSSFARWHADFPREVARYVRLRALKKTYLHLERVEVHAH